MISMEDIIFDALWTRAHELLDDQQRFRTQANFIASFISTTAVYRPTASTMHTIGDLANRIPPAAIQSALVKFKTLPLQNISCTDTLEFVLFSLLRAGVPESTRSSPPDPATGLKILAKRSISTIRRALWGRSNRILPDYKAPCSICGARAACACHDLLAEEIV